MTESNRKRSSTKDDTLSDVVASGHRLRSLEKIRDKLAALLDAEADDKTAPALAQRLAAIMAEIETLAGPSEVSTVERLRDDLATKRAMRATAQGS